VSSGKIKDWNTPEMQTEQPQITYLEAESIKDFDSSFPGSDPSEGPAYEP